MGLTTANITADIDFIFSDLADSGVMETVTRFPRGKDTPADISFKVARATQLTRDEVDGSGFEQEYLFSVFAKQADIGNTVRGDVLKMADGTRLRIFAITEQPATVMVRFELGDEFESGDTIG